MAERLTSWGPMGPEGIAGSIVAARCDLRWAILQEARGGHCGPDAERAIMGIAAALGPFADGAEPPGFGKHLASYYEAAIRGIADTIRRAPGQVEGHGRITLLFDAYED